MTILRSNSVLPLPFPVGKSAATVVRLITILTMTVGLTGCRYWQYDSAPAETSLDSPVSSASRADAQKHVESFITSLKENRYNDAMAMMAPTLRATMPVSPSLWNQSDYKALSQAKNLVYTSMELRHHGKELIVHLNFDDNASKPYRTNFSFLTSEKNWPITVLLSPTQPGPSYVSGGVVPSKTAPN